MAIICFSYHGKRKKSIVFSPFSKLNRFLKRLKQGTAARSSWSCIYSFNIYYTRLVHKTHKNNSSNTHVIAFFQKQSPFFPWSKGVTNNAKSNVMVCLNGYVMKTQKISKILSKITNVTLHAWEPDTQKR